jgi:TetR/AcrR family transcriptional regulator, lmrAB and yxaGH operons repressor
MPSETRARMIEGAARLLAQRGLQETSFSEVLQLTGAPRGSIYHHFPEGKDQLVGSAVEFAGARAMGLLAAKAGVPALEVTEYFVAMWREVLTRSNYSAGCSVLAVTVATDSGELLARAADVFRAWREQLTDLLTQGGLAPDDARRFAATLIASTEGAVVMSRAAQSTEPFDLVAEQLRLSLATIAA